MPELWLTDVAQNDLKDIAIYGDLVFGPVQSNEYRLKLEAHFRVLAENPFLFPAVEAIHQGYRRSVCGVHSIYYRLVEDDVEIVRILNRQDAKGQLES